MYEQFHFHHVSLGRFPEMCHWWSKHRLCQQVESHHPRHGELSLPNITLNVADDRPSIEEVVGKVAAQSGLADVYRSAHKHRYTCRAKQLTAK